MWWMLLVGCPSNPVRALQGTWVASDGAEHRALVFEQLDEVTNYSFYRYDVGSAPVVVQTGIASIADGELLYDVRWDQDACNHYTRFAASLVRDAGDLVLDGRRFESVESLPGPSDEAFGFGHLFWSAAVFGQTNTGGIFPSADGRTRVLQENGSDLYLQRFEPNGSGPVEVRIPRDRSLQHALDGDRFTTVGAANMEVLSLSPFEAERCQDVGRFEMWSSEASFPECGVSGPLDGGWAAICGEELRSFDPSTFAFGEAAPVPPFAEFEGGGLFRHDITSIDPPQSLHQRLDVDGRAVDEQLTRLPVAVPTVLGDATVWVSRKGDGAVFGSLDQDEPLQMAVRMRRDGQTLWEREYPSLEGDSGIRVAAYGDDLLIGTFQPEGMLLEHVNACGEVVDQQTYAVNGSGLPFFTGMAAVGNGQLELSAWVYGSVETPERPTVVATEGALVMRLQGPTPAPACTMPDPIADPVLNVVINGSGTVSVGETTCSNSCTVTAMEYARLPVEAVGADGAQVDGVAGACATVPCVATFDRVVQELTIDFVQPEGILLPTDVRIDHLQAAASLVLVTGEEAFGGTQLGSHTISGSFVATVDASGGTVVLANDLSAVLDVAPAIGDVWWTIHADGSARHWDSTGLVATVPVVDPVGGFYGAVAVDGLGQVAVLDVVNGDVSVRAVDGSWSQTFETGTTVADVVPSFIGLEAGGFAFFADAGNQFVVDSSTTLTGSFLKVLARLDGAGVPTASAVPATFTLQPGEVRLWETAGVLHYSDSATVRSIDASGVTLSETTLALGEGTDVHPWSGGYTLRSGLFSQTSPYGGPDLTWAGGEDHLFTWTDATGIVLGVSTMGSMGNDDFLFSRPTVLPDGTLVAHSDGVNGASIGVFSAP